MTRAVTLIPGDGIGPAVTDAARVVVDAAGVALEWEVHEIGQPAMNRTGDPLPPGAVASVRANGVALKGPVSTPIGRTGFRSVNASLRRELDLFAQVRPCVSRVGASGHLAADLVIVRDTTEDLYAGVELESGSEGAAEAIELVERHNCEMIPSDAGLSIKFTSPRASRRIASFALEYARTHGRSRLTAVHKASVMRCTDGLFLEEFRTVVADATDVECDDRLIDNLCGQLVRRAHDYDVLVMPNMYGDLVSELAAGLTGGVGVAAGANYGPGVAVFEPGHGTAPHLAGAGTANPAGAILSAAMMLEYIGEHGAAARVVAAVDGAIAAGQVTYDLKSDRADPDALTTRQFADEVISRL
jgi:isocitrate dehydrogenase (NAD+)